MSASTSSGRNAPPETDIGPDSSLFWDVLQAFGEWYESVGGTEVDIDSPVEELDQVAEQFERYVRATTPQLAHLVRGDPNIYYSVMVHFLGQQDDFSDEDDE